MEPLTGEYDLVSMEDQMWKRWRQIFNPGFSATHVATLSPIIMEVKIFRGILREHAKKGNLFKS